MSRLPKPLLLVFVLAFGCQKQAAPQAPDDAHVAQVVTALAAVFEAAEQVAPADELERLRSFGIAHRTTEGEGQERKALREAVSRWSDERKGAALAWVRANATWTSQLHALAIESFDEDFEVRGSGPLSWLPVELVESRGALAPLLADALSDPAIGTIAAALATQPASFGDEAIRERREKVLAYLGMEDVFPPFAAFHNPLMAQGNGVNAQLPGGAVMMVVGAAASDELRSMVLSHELAHPPINRLLSRPEVAEALEASSCALGLAEERFGYDDWRSFFGEALVRSLSYRLEGMEALDTGMVFEPFLTGVLAKWEGSDVPLHEAVASALWAIDDEFCSGPLSASCATGD